MALSVYLMGASYSDVPSIVVPSDSGGGTSQFYDITGAETALGSDGTETLEDSITALTTYANEVTSASDTNLSDAVYTLAQGYGSGGGGGASNFVTGTFTGTTTGAAMNISLSYTGSGYPVGLLICPSEGSYSRISSDSFYSTLQQYAIAQFCMTKAKMSTAPRYTQSTEDEGTVVVTYKSSKSYTSILGRTGAPAAYSYYSGGASSTPTRTAVFKNATTLSVYIASSSDGFMAGIEYTYYIVYSE